MPVTVYGSYRYDEEDAADVIDSLAPTAAHRSNGATTPATNYVAARVDFEMWHVTYACPDGSVQRRRASSAHDAFYSLVGMMNSTPRGTIWVMIKSEDRRSMSCYRIDRDSGEPMAPTHVRRVSTTPPTTAEGVVVKKMYHWLAPGPVSAYIAVKHADPLGRYAMGIRGGVKKRKIAPASSSSSSASSQLNV